MKSHLARDHVFYLIACSVVVFLSLGCFLFVDDKEPEPRPVENNCDDDEVDAIPETVDEDFTATDDCDTVGQTIIVRDATLIVETGTTLEFAEHAGIHIQEGGALQAVGSNIEPIVFTAADEDQPWKGIFFDATRSRDNILEHSVVEFAGSEVWDHEQPIGPANISVVDARLNLVDFQVLDGLGFGLYLQGRSDLHISGDNVITANAQEPVYTGPHLVDDLTAATSYVGNDSDYIFVTGGTITESATWANFDVPLMIGGVITLHANLNIEAGNELAFRNHAGIDVDEDGDLSMEGVEADELSFGDE